MGSSLKLLSYQKLPAKKIEESSHGLFMAMGTGKTVTTLTALARLLITAKIQAALVVAPKWVCELTWPDEIKKFPQTRWLTFSKLLGNEAQRTAALNKTADIYLINYENLVWLIQKLKKFDHLPFDTVVYDESTKLKSYASKRFKAATLLAPMGVKRSYILAGSPIPNGYMDLWSQIYLLDRGERLGRTITAYRNKWFYTPDRRGWEWVLREGAREEILAAISDIVTIIRFEDYHDNLPPQIHDVVVPVPMDGYQELKKELAIQLEDAEIEASTAAVLSSKLRQYAGGAVYDEDAVAHHVHSVKLDALEDIVEQTESNVLVLIDFRFQRDAILKRFGKKAEFLRGSRDVIDRWNRGEVQILVCHPASMGHGLNLQSGGNVIVFLDLPWNEEFYNQSIARLHRKGQKKQVHVYRILAKDTVDFLVAARLEGKIERQEELKQWLLEHSRIK